jgi:hypothetical protein
LLGYGYRAGDQQQRNKQITHEASDDRPSYQRRQNEYLEQQQDKKQG